MQEDFIPFLLVQKRDRKKDVPDDFSERFQTRFASAKQNLAPRRSIAASFFLAQLAFNLKNRNGGALKGILNAQCSPFSSQPSA